MSAPEKIHAFARPTGNKPLTGFRSFPITNAESVELPGCLEIEEVRLNNAIIPPYETHRVPTDGTHENFKEIQVVNYQLDESGPVPVVLRSLGSNDGRWQVGQTLHVKGIFVDPAPAEPQKAAEKAAEKPSTAEKAGEKASEKAAEKTEDAVKATEKAAEKAADKA